MIILAVESSCDETAIALVEFKNSRAKVLSNVISSQIKIHREWGGVVPNLAKREHQKNLVPVLKRALKKAGMLEKARQKLKKIKNCNFKLKELQKILEREGCLYEKLNKFLNSYQKPKINLLAVTAGPGLEPALWSGVNFSKALSCFWKLPIVPVNHIESHIFAYLIDRKFDLQDKTIFPAVCLSVSGGHTQLFLMKDYGKYRLLGETRDDTAGECFDKVARMLGLGYPGGAIIEKLAKKGNPGAFQFPRPMLYTKDYDFSFSGLKTAVLYFLKKQNRKTIEKRKNDICASFQQAVIDVLVLKTIKAAKAFNVKTITIGGGVSANRALKKRLKDMINEKISKTKYFAPDTKLCTDNAAMVALAAYFRWLKKSTKNWKEIEANANLTI